MEGGRGGVPGEKITDAVVTVPAYFNDSQRTATRRPAASPGSTCCASSTSPPRQPCLRPGQGERTDHPGLRPGRRNLRRVHPGYREGRLRSEVHGGHTPNWAATTGTSASSTGWPTISRHPTASTCARTRWPCRGYKEAAEKAKIELSTTNSTTSTCPSSPRPRKARCIWT